MSATARMRRRIVSPTQGLNPMGENTADFADKFEPVGGKNFFYIRYLNRGCAGSLLRKALWVQISLLSGKIQGNFADLTAKAGRRLDFPTISQLVTPKFPTHPNREFSGANRELFPAEQGKNLGRMEFSERTGLSRGKLGDNNGP